MLNSFKFVTIVNNDDKNDQIDTDNSNIEDNEDSDEKGNDNDHDNN